MLPRVYTCGEGGESPIKSFKGVRSSLVQGLHPPRDSPSDTTVFEPLSRLLLDLCCCSWYLGEKIRHRRCRSYSTTKWQCARMAVHTQVILEY